jgi:hypothetical protein
MPRPKKTGNGENGALGRYPRHDVLRALRIPRALLEQNAGRECTDREAAKFAGVGFGGPFRVEISSSIKYGFLERPKSGSIAVSDLARQAIRPQKPEDETAALRQAILNAPDIAEVYKHYRGENLPDRTFLDHALTDKFGIPRGKEEEFFKIFVASLEAAKLLERAGDKARILDISQDGAGKQDQASDIAKLSRNVTVSSDDTCFVMMPFAAPIGDYYATLFEPAIQKTGLTPIRADADIFGTGKIMDQVWRGLNNAKVLVAVLTGRNPNVFYELGLAHALKKPVVLVSSNEEDVPFDLHHIRVIYYDVNDPFWGAKPIEKVAENILSALKNPEEAVFQNILEQQ